MGFYSRGGGPIRRPRRPSRPRPTYAEVVVEPDASVVLAEFLNSANKFGNNPRVSSIDRLGGRLTQAAGSVRNRAAEAEAAKCICVAVATPFLVEIANSKEASDDIGESATELALRVQRHDEASTGSAQRGLAEDIYTLLIEAADHFDRRGSDRFARVYRDGASALSNAYANRPEQAARNAAWAVARFASLPHATTATYLESAVVRGINNAMLAHKKPPSALPVVSPQSQEQAAASPLLTALAEAFEIPTNFPNTGNNPKLEIKRARIFLQNIISEAEQRDSADIVQQLTAMLVFFERPDAAALFARPDITARFAAKAATLTKDLFLADEDAEDYEMQEHITDLLIALMGERL
jgi:hypothetical protein